ncbi:MAG: IS481 family transposase [Chlamydiales bacterium]
MRQEFVAQVNAKVRSISQLCRDYKITRKTAYKWIHRFSTDGAIGLYDRSRRPCHMPLRVDKDQVQLILDCRDKYPAWGAKKLRQILINEGRANLPSLSSFNRILARENRISPEEIEKRRQFIRFERKNPNELWQMDFKGHFEISEGRCHPLTVLDDCSRFSISLKACSSENKIVVRRALEEAFHEYGLPLAMTMDNGSPWKGYPGQRLSDLTVWLMRLGIKISHSRPNHPQTQGKDERFHRTLKEEVLKFHNFRSLIDAQSQFDEWREIYNYIRPHEALEMQCPGQKYRQSERKYTGYLAPIEYRLEDTVKKVGDNGEVSFMGHRIYVGSFLKGEHIALRQRKEREWDIYYVESRIGSFKRK